LFANSDNVIALRVDTSDGKKDNVRLLLSISSCIFDVDDIDVDNQNTQIEEMKKHSNHMVPLGVLVPLELD
jgi:hypothetical protein